MADNDLRHARNRIMQASKITGQDLSPPPVIPVKTQPGNGGLLILTIGTLIFFFFMVVLPNISLEIKQEIGQATHELGQMFAMVCGISSVCILVLVLSFVGCCVWSDLVTKKKEQQKMVANDVSQTTPVKEEEQPVESPKPTLIVRQAKITTLDGEEMIGQIMSPKRSEET